MADHERDDPVDPAGVKPGGRGPHRHADTENRNASDTLGVDPTPHEPAPRTRRPMLAGYEILEELGRGNMGVVYKARQLGLDRLVAVKMIRADSQAGGEELRRFLVEARVVGGLHHPNIVQLYDIDLQHDPPYFSMELVEGGTLADRLGGRPQPFRQSAQFVQTVARAIHTAHVNGIVHRDLKPANILISPPPSPKSAIRQAGLDLMPDSGDLCTGTPKITDFGLAKRLHGDSGQTESGMILGTPSYMAPEQAEGRSREVGPAADIYALGAILYEMLTGRPPFTAQSPMETVLLLFQMEPVSPSRLQPRLPRDLEVICLKCLRKEPSRRYASAEELADDLARFLAGEPIRARPLPLHEKAWKWVRRHPALGTLVGCAVLGALGLLGMVLWYHGDLQARLRQALEDEREARATQEAVSERERIGQLEGRLKDLVHAAEAALAAEDWNAAQLQLTRARDQAGDAPELAEMRARVEELLRVCERRRIDHERLATFHRRRNDALFQATLFTGGDLGTAVRETRTAAREALAVFGVTPESAAPPRLDTPNYTAAQKAEVVAACYELLLVLADAVAQAGDAEAATADRATEALAILDRAASWGVDTQAYHQRRAAYLVQAGKTRAAAEERRKAEAVRPSTALDHFLLGQERYRQGDSKRALLDFENVLQVEPDHFWASYYAALCWLKTQRPDRATTYLTACLVQRRDFPWLFVLRASAWGELGQYERAEADCEAAAKATLSDDARYALLINRGVLRIREGRPELAVADLQQAIALRPQQYQGYVNLAQAHLKGRQLDDALRQLDRAIEREPALASLYRTRARLHLLRQDEAAALADMEQTVRLEAKAGSPGLMEDRLECGRLLHRRKEYKRALAEYDAALRVRPHEPRASRLKAEALLELKRLPDALEALDDCIKYGPPDAGAFRARAVVRTRLGQYPGAQTDYTRALELEPDAATYAARGWCYVVADAPRLALTDFAEAIRLGADGGDAYAGRGYCRALLGEGRTAVEDAERALRSGPASPRLYYNAARIYSQAVGWLDSDASRERWTAASLRGNWQERALHLIGKALDSQAAPEAARFWQNVVQGDKAMNPIRRSAGFAQLASRYPLPRPAGSPRERNGDTP